MFSWMPLIGEWNPGFVGFLLVGLPTIFAMALFVGRMKAREATENLARFAKPLSVMWILIGCALFSFSLGSALAGAAFVSWTTGVLAVIAGMIVMPLAFVVVYGLTENNQGMTYSEMLVFSLGQVIILSALAAIVLALALVALLTAPVLLTFGAIAGAESVTGIGIHISDMTSIVIFTVVLIIAMIGFPILLGGLP